MYVCTDYSQVYWIFLLHVVIEILKYTGLQVVVAIRWSSQAPSEPALSWLPSLCSVPSFLKACYAAALGPTSPLSGSLCLSAFVHSSTPSRACSQTPQPPPQRHQALPAGFGCVSPRALTTSCPLCCLFHIWRLLGEQLNDMSKPQKSLGK